MSFGTDRATGKVNLEGPALNNLVEIAARLLSSGAVAAADLLASILSVLGATTGAAVISDASGTVQQYARGLVTLVAARLPTIGTQAATASLSVTPDSSGYWGLFYDLSTAGGSRTYDAAQKTASLPAGRYLLSATSTCHVKTGPQASVTATVGGCTRLPVDAVIGATIDGTNDAISAIKENDVGVLYYVKVS